ncbi:uncharacterized protein LOC141651017 [Silene latifolia]|uniref:uncharacterized protein LOC141651017 n=1 Tax=Silene latifolia TaxID=37657 RepID=UPI003D779C99
MQQGFINGCRPFIEVDGTHMKGKFGVTILIACALDGDNEIFRLAYAVVDKETSDTWEFFFYQLNGMAPDASRSKWIICSDKQKVDEVTNNLVESFNASIRELKSLPILSMLEALRRKCTKNMHTKRNTVTKWNSIVCPKLKELCDRTWDEGYYCIPISTGEGLYDVKDGNHYYNVNLRKLTCDCQSWQNLGISFKHAASAIRHTRGKLEHYVHSYYSTHRYAQIGYNLSDS